MTKSMKQKRKYQKLYSPAEYNKRWMDSMRTSKFLDEITPIIGNWADRLKKRKALKEFKNK